MSALIHPDPESLRLAEDARREKNWKRWGPYLAERQWGTVREDYSPTGEVWGYFTHDHARSRAYRWGEDGLLGFCDREARLCFAVALWNEQDPILKERCFGLTGPEGNHGEDVKELYYYLDSTPTHSYCKALYKYPQRAYPYALLVGDNRGRGKRDTELDLEDTGIFDDQRYFDVEVEYAKASADDVLVAIHVHNRGPDDAPLHVLPTLWFRNTWSWGRTGEGYPAKPSLVLEDAGRVRAEHETLGAMLFHVDAGPDGAPKVLFTENETNAKKLFGAAANHGPVKDAFHDYVVSGDASAVSSVPRGTKCAAHHRVLVPARGTVTLRARLCADGALVGEPFGAGFDAVLDARRAEADLFYEHRLPHGMSDEERNVARQAYGGLLWSKQFYGFVVPEWLDGDPAQPKPPVERLKGRNAHWRHFHARDVISMPDKWEYPWFAAWDLAFHMLPFSRVDPVFAKDQLVLLLREWFMHENGQIPAYEFAFGDVNPPVHAWAAWRVYKLTGARGQRDRLFLARVFHKLLLNFTWWVNRKDVEGNNLFGGGFLGLDNIGIFDRSRPLPGGARLEQADGTAWMAFYCTTMLAMALELAKEDPAYEDVASKFFEHFVAITTAMNSHGGTGLWNDDDGFYYDQLQWHGKPVPLRIRSVVGVIPLFAVELLEDSVLEQLPGFRKRMQWFLDNRKDLAGYTTYMTKGQGDRGGHRLLAVPSRERLVRVLRYVLDEQEFLSPYGVRSLSRAHRDKPYEIDFDGDVLRVQYEPGESESGMFGGNSNWRGPVWFPVNFLLVEALERYHHFYGDSLRVEHPTGSGKMCTLAEVAADLEQRLTRPFLPGPDGRRPCHGDESRYATDPHFRELLLFHEHFHGEDGHGLGASHQTGWTALVTNCLEDVARRRYRTPGVPRT